jgi:uncharacterized protein
MPYLTICLDHPGMEVEREAAREAHRAHLASVGDRLISAGALLDDDGVTIIGGATLLDTEDEDEARRFESEDPYAKAGIRRSVQVLQWRLRWWQGAFHPDGYRKE